MVSYIPELHGTTSAIAEQGSELFLLYNDCDISCKSEVTWVVSEVSELNEQHTQRLGSVPTSHVCICYCYTVQMPDK